jgi:hypothetical protein
VVPGGPARSGFPWGQVVVNLNLVVMLGLLLWGVLVLAGARTSIRSKVRHLEPSGAGRELP